MAAGDLVTQPGQIEIWRSDADRLLMGKGTDYRWLEMGGVAVPGMRVNDYTKPLSHGSIMTIDRLESRQIPVQMVVIGSGQADLAEKLTALGKVFRPVRIGESDAVLTYWHWGSQKPQRVVGRPRRAEWGVSRRSILGAISAIGWMFEASDPRWYAGTEQSKTVTMDAGVSSITAMIYNSGNMEMEPVLELTGPWTNPRITNTQDGSRQIRIDIALTAGQTLIVDIGKRTVTLGGVDQYATVRADNQWWELLPGANSISASRTGTTGSAVMVVKWRSAWDTAGDPTFDPSDIAGLQLNLDAAKVTGFTHAGAVSTWADESGNGRNATQGTVGSQPWWSDRDRWLSLPGTSGAYASSPDSVGMSITGDFCYIAKVSANSWASGGNQNLVVKWNGDGNLLRLTATGFLELIWTPAVGAAISKLSTVAVGLTNGQDKWLAAGLDVINPAATGNDVTFWMSDDGMNWTQLGATVTTTGITTVKDTAHQVIIGGRSDVGNENFAGKIYYAEIRGGLNPNTGTVVANPNFARVAGTTVTDDSGQVWTMQGTASIGTGAVRTPDIEFRGNDFLSLPNFLTGYTEGTLFILVKAEADPPNSEVRSGAWTFSAAASGDSHWPWYATGAVYETFGTNTQRSWSPGPSLSSQYRVHSVVAGPGDWRAYLDGDVMLSTGTNTVSWNTAPKIGMNNGGTRFFNGRIRKIWFYNRKLTDSERQQVEAALLRG